MHLPFTTTDVHISTCALNEALISNTSIQQNFFEGFNFKISKITEIFDNVNSKASIGANISLD